MQPACFVYKPVPLEPFISPLRKHVHSSYTCKIQNVLVWCTHTHTHLGLLASINCAGSHISGKWQYMHIHTYIFIL